MPIRPILLLLMLAAPAAVAELQWLRLQVERSIDASAASATGTFAFTSG
jgi:hypothetical protein